MKRTVCPYCKKVMTDSDYSFRFRCQYCKEYLVDIDKTHCRPERYWKNDNSRSSKN